MDKVKETVKAHLTAYLEQKGYRKTPERFAILDEIYSYPGHFNAEILLKKMDDRNYRVSVATMYNTLQLLLECGLIVKHTYKDDMAYYERAFGLKHDHLICTCCGRVEEFTDRRTDEVLKQAETRYGFKVHRHTLYIYGECKRCCKLKMKKEAGSSL